MTKNINSICLVKHKVQQIKIKYCKIEQSDPKEFIITWSFKFQFYIKPHILTYLYNTYIVQFHICRIFSNSF